MLPSGPVLGFLHADEAVTWSEVSYSLCARTLGTDGSPAGRPSLMRIMEENPKLMGAQNPRNAERSIMKRLLVAFFLLAGLPASASPVEPLEGTGSPRGRESASRGPSSDIAVRRFGLRSPTRVSSSFSSARV